MSESTQTIRPTHARKMVRVTWNKTSDVNKWEKAAEKLGYKHPAHCVRDLAEEALALKMHKMEQQQAMQQVA